MATIECTNEQLRAIQFALELYSRIGMLQLEFILEHPTIENLLINKNSPQKDIEVGDRCLQGEVVRLSPKYVWTKGQWGGEEEVRKFKRAEVKLSPDWSKVHARRDEIRELCGKIKLLASEGELYINGHYGIHNKDLDSNCRVCYDIVQVIRNEFWKADKNPNKYYNVSSSVHLSSEAKPVKVVVNEPI